MLFIPKFIHFSSGKTNKFKNNKNSGGMIKNKAKNPIINGKVIQAKKIPEIISKIVLLFFNRSN
uniref:hypothetical protein n=1 Tax=Staphylococcus epidermidis TaxID=1282 RepID=UPI001A94B111|nr:hypothetical protein [Staphylococcus epidermidis]